MLKHKNLYLLLAIVLLAASQVWLSHLRVRTAQQHSDLKAEKKAISQEVQSLRLELASLTRPDTLRRLAHEKLGMRAPRAVQVIQQ